MLRQLVCRGVADVHGIGGGGSLPEGGRTHRLVLTYADKGKPGITRLRRRATPEGGRGEGRMMDRVSGSRLRKRLSRRQLLITAGAGGAGAALSRLAPWEAGIAPAQIKGTTLRILTWSHFVPAYDTAFDKFVAEWGQANGVNARVDHIPIDQLPTRIASELSAGAGHDIFQMNGQIQTTLYYKNMVDVSDICEKLGKQYGGWIPMAKNVAVVDGGWHGLPEFYIAQPLLWRTDLFGEYGLKAPSTWEDLRQAAKIGKAKGHACGGLEPRGAAGRAAVVDPTILAIWKFSKNQETAKAFLEHYGNNVQFSLVESKGYNLPYLKGWYKKPMPGVGDDPKVAKMQDWDKVAYV